MSRPRFILLCNNRIAIPAIIELGFHGHLAAVIVPEKNKEVRLDLEELLNPAGIPLETVNRKTLQATVQKKVEESGAEAGLLMTFPYKLSPEIFSIPPKGFLNFHYGTLPEYRGPEPIFAQLKNGEEFAGLTIHIVDETIDGGPVVTEEKLRIETGDTYGMLQTKLAYLGAKLSSSLVKVLEFGTTIPSRKQDETKAGYHKRPGLDDVLIRWEEMDSSGIRALVNACNPWNKGAGTRINRQMFSILEAEILEEETGQNIAPGTIVSLNSGELLIATKDNKLLNARIVYSPEGFMSGDRLAQFGIKAGDRFF